MKRLYDAALFAARGAAGLWAALSPGASDEWSERRARSLPSPAPGGAWIHGSSVGEARLVRALAGEIRRRRGETPLSVSAWTATGRRTLPSPPEVAARFLLPLDAATYQRRLLAAVRPAVVVLVETELWPNLVAEAGAASIPVVLVNGRLSPERMRRYRRLSGLYRPLLESLARVGAAGGSDAERLAEAGVPAERLEITGNLKFDLPVPAAGRAELRGGLGWSEATPVVAAGSTGEGEDALVLDAFLAARAGHPGARLILAPRHPERFDAAEKLSRARGLRVARASAGGGAEGADVLLVDEIGKLATLYGAADAAFVGGSLVPVGGHNVLEPGAAGVPALFGPHTGHVADVASSLVEAGGAVRVGDAAELGRALARLLSDPAARRAVARAAAVFLEANRGALSRSVDLVFRAAGWESSR